MDFTIVTDALATETKDDELLVGAELLTDAELAQVGGARGAFIL